MSRRVVIVEDHALLADTVGLALGAEGLDVDVAPLTGMGDVVERVRGQAPCLTMLDLDLGSLGDGVDLVPDLVAAGADVLVVTGDHDPVRLASALAAGAVGYVTKDASFDVLVDTITRASAGEPVIDANARQELLAGLRRARAERDRTLAPFDSLTPRERDVLQAIADGKTAESIAAEWVVSVATVRTQVRGVLTKLDCTSQLAAVAKARRAGWLERRLTPTH
jgi:DNA-binding NarL/FixJ family response regulator